MVMIVIENVEIRGVRLFLDDDYDVIEESREALGERVERD